MKKYTAGILPFFTAILILSAFIAPRQAAATIGFVNQWPATPPIVSNSNASPVNGKFSVGAGNNRLLVVTVATEYSAAQAPTFTVSYGGQSLNGGNGGVILNNTTGNNKIWIGYLKEAGIVAAGSNKTLTITPSITTNLTALYATAAVFSGVDQTTPISGFNSLGRTTTATTVGPVAYTLTGNAGLTGNTGMSVYLVNWNNSVSQTTASTGYTEIRDYIGTNFSLSGSYKTTTGASAENVTSTSTAAAIGALGGFGLNPATRIAAVSTCGDCHRYPPGDASARNTPPGLFRGSHEKHSGGNDKEYGYACNYCHYNVGGSAYNHSSGFKNITGSKLPGNAYSQTKKIAININPTFGTCSNTACHSTGRSNVQYSTTALWGTNGTTTCLSCHAGRAGATGTGAQANSTAGFKLSTTHSQHLKYPAANMNCQMCHSKTTSYDVATASLVLKNYTATLYHANGTANVRFSDIAYASYTSYKTSKNCTNTSCHGGTTKSPWINTGAVNTDNACLHCHGYGTRTNTALRADKYNAAPGWGGNGVSTDNISVNTDKRVGAHYVHLSSVYSKKMKCNECHKVPSTPFSSDTNHTLNTLRFNSATLDFTQSSSARILIGVASSSTPAQLSAFNGYTSGTADKAATCSSVYCHGNRLKNAVTSGTARKPSWNVDLTATPPTAASCAKCHGFPPLDGGLHSAGDTTCSSCHPHLATGVNPTSFLDKSLHINGRVNGGGHAKPYYATDAGHTSCMSGIGCHTNSAPTAVYPAGGIPNCRACHQKADPTVAGNNCGSCHGATGVSATGEPNGTVHPDAAGSHAKHTVLTLATCAYCHNGGGTGTNANHGQSSVGTNIVNITAGQGWSANTCTTSYCHSTVQVANGGAGAPTYKPTTIWVGGAAMTCASCHGNTSANLTTGSHVRHLSTTIHATYTCANCHTGFENGNTAAHSNQIINVQQSLIKGSTGTYGDSAGPPGNGYGSCSLSYCHSTVQSTTGGALIAGNYKTVNWGGAALNCGSCHGNTNTTLLTGSHANHLNAAYGYTCATCHGTAGGAGNTAIHANEIINLDMSAKGPTATYSGDGTPQNSNFGACSTTVCHGRNSGTWGSAGASSQACTECHGQVNTAYLNFSSAIIAPGGLGVDTAGNTAATTARVGAHQTHLLASSNISDKMHCGECHTVHTTIGAATHLNYTTATVTFGPLAKAESHTTAAVSRVSGVINCSNTYCHTAKTNTGTALTPAWDNTTYLTATTNLVMADCKKCHNMPPADANHTGIANLTAFPAGTCNCHTTLSGSATTVAAIFTDKTKHINGIVEQDSTCISCHASVQTGTHGTPRAAVVGEFGLAWGHKKSGRGAVTDADCIVCHLEGEYATQKTSATLHKDGNIDLRDPDGTGEARITNMSNASYTFTKFATSYASGARTSTGHTANTVDNIITQKFCLKCHDANGATNTSARSGTSPTATNPFGSGKLAINNAAEFATTNSSKHPVLGPLTRDYPAATRMAIPYKPTGTRGTSGTKTAGVVMNCFDCHNTPTTPLTTRTVSAHGNAQTIRGTIGVATPTLCAICHLGYTASTTVGHNSGSLTSGSAYSSAENRMQTEQDNCNYCHADVLAPARPARATNVHGTNVLGSGGVTKTGRWLAGGANGVPVAFIRNTTYLSNHQPKFVGQAWSPQCSMTTCASRAGSPYSLGGTY